MVRTPLMTFGLIVALVAAPAVGTLLYAHMTGDHSVRPMSLSANAVRSRLFGSAVAVEAEITIGARGMSDPQRAALETQIEQAFKRREVPVDVSFIRDSDVAENSIIYRIGSNDVGPLPLRRASEGVRTAIDAYRISN